MGLAALAVGRGKYSYRSQAIIPLSTTLAAAFISMPKTSRCLRTVY